MKSPFRTIHIASLCAGMLVLISCSNEPEDKQDRMEDRMQSVQEDIQDVDMTAQEDFEKDRHDILGDLRDLRADINDDLSDSEKALAEADLDAEDRDRHERVRSELLRHRAIVENHIEQVDNASINAWDNVRSETRNMLDEAGLFYTRENLERRRGLTGTTGGAGVYPEDQPGDGTVNTNRDLDLNRNADEVR